MDWDRYKGGGGAATTTEKKYTIIIIMNSCESKTQKNRKKERKLIIISQYFYEICKINRAQASIAVHSSAGSSAFSPPSKNTLSVKLPKVYA